MSSLIPPSHSKPPPKKSVWRKTDGIAVIPKKVSLVYTPDSQWRNRAEFVNGRAGIVAFLTRRWAMEPDYRLIKEIWAHDGDRIAVRFAYEWHDDSGSWFRSYGNENWEFNTEGLMQRRFACINDMPIRET